MEKWVTRRRTFLSCKTISMHYIDDVLRPHAIQFLHKTSKITITPLETVESYLKYNIHYRLAMSTNSDYMEARHCRNALVYKVC